MVKFIAVAALVLFALYFVVRAIFKLPSRYERSPKTLSPWNALDEGIDPTISDKPTS